MRILLRKKYINYNVRVNHKPFQTSFTAKITSLLKLINKMYYLLEESFKTYT